MRQLITSADVFSEIDLTRPIASVQRIGEGKYRVTLLTENRETIDRDTFPTIEDAMLFCEGIASLVEADPQNPAYKTAVLSQLEDKNNEIRELKVRVAELEAQVPIPVGGLSDLTKSN